ncbi:MAG: hypothetical protein GX569_06650 [Candidatus Riflebacteria bacterium]|nr:hypothetical protein [Candidatus Riflebacteria bacterium]
MKRLFLLACFLPAVFAGMNTVLWAESEATDQTLQPAIEKHSDEMPTRNCDFPYGVGNGKPAGYNCYTYGKDSGGVTEENFSNIPVEELAADADCEIDLIGRRFGSRKPEAVQMFASDPCGQAVVKVVLDPSKTEYTKARFELHYGDEIEGWTLNIGDSVSNNGHGGDGADQTRDSEVQILDSDLALFGDDTAPTGEAKILARSTGLAVPGAVVVVEVSNNQISWHNDKGVDGVIKSEYVFSLAGQGDAEGQPNYDIYAGFNRVVVGGRVGKGLKRVKIKLFH